MKYRVGSVFSGVAGLCGGFEDAGFEIVFQVEIDDAARGVLDYLYPTVPKFADIRDVGKHNLPPCDVLVGGFPCQDLSVAGSRAGITGRRSSLFSEMMRVADELRAAWVVWENVPGLLSSFSPCDDPPEPVEGREWEVEESSDFETVLRGLAQCGYRGAWRVLDAQLFGVPQRRERIFGVFTRLPAGAERAAEVLAIRQSVCGDPPKGRKARKDVAAPLTGGTPGSGPGCGEDAAAGHLVVGTFTELGEGHVTYQETEVAGPVRTNAGGGSQKSNLVAFGRNNTSGPIGTTGALMGQCGGRGDFETETFIIQDCREGNKDQNGLGIVEGGPAYTLQANNHMGVAHAVYENVRGEVKLQEKVNSLTGGGGKPGQGYPCVIHPPDQVIGSLVASDGGPTSSDPVAAGHVVCVTGTVTHTLTAEGSDASEDGTGRGTPIIAFGCKDGDPRADIDLCPTLRSMSHTAGNANGGGQVAIAFGEKRDAKGTRLDTQADLAYTLRNPGDGGRTDQNLICTPEYIVRRLTPVECARLMGWADDTCKYKVVNGKVVEQKDAPRYRQAGNGVVRPVARYVAARLKRVMEDG